MHGAEELFPLGCNRVIIQEHANAYRFITQHDHGRISGILAQAWRDPVTGSSAQDVVIAATYLHDILWVPLDLLPRVDSDKPLDFIAFPEDDKLRAYEHGIQAMAALDPYIGLLHARHFSEFISREKHPKYRASMDALIASLGQKITEAQRTRADEELALLRLFDVFSLLLCMSGPHVARTPPPWLDPSPLLVQRGLDAFWPAPDVFALSPYPFSTPLELAIPYKETPKTADMSALLAAYAGAPVAWHRVRVRAPTEEELSARIRARATAS